MSIPKANNIDLDKTIYKIFAIVRRAGIKYEHDFGETTNLWDGEEVELEVRHFEHDDVRIDLDYIPNGDGFGESVLSLYFEDKLMFRFNRTTNMISYFNADWMFLVDHLFEMIPKLQKERNKKVKKIDENYKTLKKVQ